MTFKKDGEDPVTNSPSPTRIGLNWVGAVAMALGLVPQAGGGQPEDEFRYRRSGKGRKHRYPKKRNMRLVSKRVRRKHRRARKVA